MKQMSNPALKKKNDFLWCWLIILPAVLLGALAMAAADVSPFLWGMQLAAWAVLPLPVLLLRRMAGCIPVAVWVVVLVAALAASLLGEPVEGARRWLALGFLTVNAAMLLLPALLMVAYRVRIPHPIILLSALVLCFQPDLSQLAAFVLAVLPLLWMHRKQRLWMMAGVVSFLILAVWCLLTPVSMEPVSYSEEILALLGEVFKPLQAVGWLALAAIPAFFAYSFVRHRSKWMLSLAIYYAVCILFGLTGEYPTLFMGYGLSPIVGMGLAWLCCDGERVS